jgi:hypothetical protein
MSRGGRLKPLGRTAGYRLREGERGREFCQAVQAPAQVRPGELPNFAMHLRRGRANRGCFTADTEIIADAGPHRASRVGRLECRPASP